LEVSRKNELFFVILVNPIRRKNMLRQSTKTLTTVQKRLLSATPQFLPLRTEYEAPLYAIPGDAKRRTLDVTKQQPTYESPYSGHPGYNPEPPGVRFYLTKVTFL
jgi:hypothetical protein